MGSIRPLGDNIILFPHGSPFAVLADEKSPWPVEAGKALGMGFSGYQVDALKRPTWLYAFREMKVEDFISASGPAGLHRTLKFAGPPPTGLYLRLAVGKLTAAGASAWRLNDELTITVAGGITRGKGAQMELLVPVRFDSSNPQLEIDYVW